MEELKNDESNENPSHGSKDNDLLGLMKKMAVHICYLEKKLDAILEKLPGSDEGSGGGSRFSPRPFRSGGGGDRSRRPFRREGGFSGGGGGGRRFGGPRSDGGGSSFDRPRGEGGGGGGFHRREGKPSFRRKKNF